MASLQCSHCKAGIRYHGEPEGIEYVFIKEIDWDRIISSRFDPLNKRYLEGSASPMLFQTDTIEIEFESSVHKAWKCPKCKALMFFDKNGKVAEAYKTVLRREAGDTEGGCRYVVFDDYSWDNITESAFPDWMIDKKFTPTAFAQLIDSNYLIISRNGVIIEQYEKIETLPET